MNIEKVVSVLKTGGIVVLPTDTIYGFSCDALNTRAVDKIYKIKNRKYEKPMIILVSNKEMLMKYCNIKNNIENDLIDKYMPGKLTIILNKKDNIPSIVTANKDTIAVRIPDNKDLIDIINKLGNPIISTSCNISNENPSYCIKDIDTEIIKSVDYVVDGEKLSNSSSTIVKVENKVKILRDGDLSENIKITF